VLPLLIRLYEDLGGAVTIMILKIHLAKKKRNDVKSLNGRFKTGGPLGIPSLLPVVVVLKKHFKMTLHCAVTKQMLKFLASRSRRKRL
jgi:hypothetical protein